jgi:hypothetical protein
MKEARNWRIYYIHRIMGWPEFRVISGPATLFWEFWW